MFKKVLQSISKSLTRQSDVAPVKAAPPAKTEAKAATPPPPAGPPPSATAKAAPAPVKHSAAPKTPEEMLGIDSKMNKEQIRDVLKLLYRRYNRAASSLENATRLEADTMLDAIVAVREKHFGEI